MDPDTLDILIKLGLAALLGGLIGLEREMHSQPAGLRTHMVVAIGSALIMLVSIHMMKFGKDVDPTRIAAQVVSGMGFLGAGAILRFGLSVSGLTTAACLWTAAGIGLAVGSGYYSGAVIATLIVLLTVLFFDKLERFLLVERTYKKFIVLAKDNPGIIGRIEGLLERHGVTIKQIGLHKDLVEKKVQVTITAMTPKQLNFDSLSKEISSLPDVEQLEIS